MLEMCSFPILVNENSACISRTRAQVITKYMLQKDRITALISISSEMKVLHGRSD